MTLSNKHICAVVELRNNKFYDKFVYRFNTEIQSAVENYMLHCTPFYTTDYYLNLVEELDFEAEDIDYIDIRVEYWESEVDNKRKITYTMVID